MFAVPGEAGAEEAMRAILVAMCLAGCGGPVDGTADVVHDYHPEILMDHEPELRWCATDEDCDYVVPMIGTNCLDARCR